MMSVRNDMVVSAAFGAFTVTDGALRMIVLLYFHDVGFGAASLASLFVLYELVGVAARGLGGRIGAGRALRRTLALGLGIQVASLLLTALHDQSWPKWSAIAWVTILQGGSGLARDLTTRSAIPAARSAANGRAWSRVARSSGSTNGLRAAGYFVGAVLLGRLGFADVLVVLALVIAVFLVGVLLVPGDLGRTGGWPKPGPRGRDADAMTRLSAAGFLLVASRDIWFVIALPVYLEQRLAWSYGAIGAFLGCWVVVFVLVQAIGPEILGPVRGSASGAIAFLPPMAAAVLLVAAAVWADELPALITVAGLVVFGVLLALTSSVHSHLVLAYAPSDHEAEPGVGPYPASTAAGRLAGTVLSGALFGVGGLGTVLTATAIVLVMTFVVSWSLPEPALRRRGGAAEPPGPPRLAARTAR